MSAVNAAVASGVADLNRVVLFGHSFGGYGAFALLTYTRRFKAAVVLAGFDDLISFYGTFDARLRYDDAAQRTPFGPWLAESGQIGLAATPWTDMWRYLRNSPIAYLDRVETPVMIVHGDADYVPIQQSEEYFEGLYRLRKRARFVRYWGEGHNLMSPANIRDLWERIFLWFDHYTGSRPVAGEHD
jgi:dipeptidyl aminopeptidase/acylaminoacyl peptidase